MKFYRLFISHIIKSVYAFLFQTRRTTKTCVKPPAKKKSKKQTESLNTAAENPHPVKEKKSKIKNKKIADKNVDASAGGILKKDKEVIFINPKFNEKDALVQDAEEVEMKIAINVEVPFFFFVWIY